MVAHGTFLAFTANHMELAFDNATIVAAVLACAPIVLLLAVANARIFFLADDISRLQLGRLNFLRPAFDHPFAVINDKLQAHELVIVPNLLPHTRMRKWEISAFPDGGWASSSMEDNHFFVTIEHQGMLISMDKFATDNTAHGHGVILSRAL